MQIKKFWIVYATKNNGILDRFESRVAANEAAQRLADKDRDNSFVIMEAVGVTKAPVPQIEVIELT